MRRCTAEAIRSAKDAARAKVAAAATGKGSGSSHSRADADGGYTGVLEIDAKTYEEIMARSALGGSPREQDA
jgi:hypothetical protein